MPDTPRPPVVRAAALAVRGELAVPPDWPATGRARCPRWMAVLLRAGLAAGGETDTHTSPREES